MNRAALLFLFCFSLWSCGSDSEEDPPEFVRSVTTKELRLSSPPPGRLIPGVVTPYRQTAIPFEVTGRVLRLIDIGEDVEGGQVDREGVVVQPGTVLAELDQAPLQRALNRAKQRLESARLQLKAQEVQLNTVLPARLDSANSQAEAAELGARYARNEVTALESAVNLARTTLERNRGLLPTGAVSDITVRQSENELQSQKARLEQAQTLVTTREREHDSALAAAAEIQGSITLQEASNSAQSASIKELEEAVRDAESDLENCVLRAPFPGRVTTLHVGEGSFVTAGQSVVTLTMMNPIEAIINVSAKTEEELVVGTDAMIFPMTGSEVNRESGIRASVFQKRGIADTNTRTFEIGLIAPNKRRSVQGDFASLPRVPYVIPIFENPLDQPGQNGLYTLANAAVDEGDNAWVLRVVGLSQGARSAETLEGILKAEKLPVTIGQQTIQVASFSLVRLMGSSDLNAGDLLVPDPTPEHADGFIVNDNRWILRPGDLVQVAVAYGELSEGFYLPVQAIRELNGKKTIFAAQSDNTVRAIEVEVRESSGELRRVVSESLEEGIEIVHEGAQFLYDGDKIARQGGLRRLRSLCVIVCS